MIEVIPIIISSSHHHRIHHALLAHHLFIHTGHHHHSGALKLLRTVSERILIVVGVKVRAHILSGVPSSSHHIRVHHFLAHLRGQVFVETQKVRILIQLLILLFHWEERIVASRAAPSTCSHTVRAPYHSRGIKSIEVASASVV